MRIVTSNLYKFLSIIFFLGLAIPLRSQVQNKDTLSQVGLQEVIVSALRLPFKESSVPYSVSVINANANTKGLSLAEDIAGIPGLEVDARYNYAVGDRITDRGFGARTQFGVRGIRIVSDDMPVTFADGQSNLEMIDLQNLASVELLRGPGSALYGNASGGVLILHSNEISEDRFLSSISSTTGSNGLFRWNGLIEGTLGKTEVSGSYSDFQYDGFRDHASAEYKRAIFKLVSNLSPADNLKIQFGYVNFNSLNPGSLTKQEADQDPEKANPACIGNAAGQDGNQAQLAGIWKHRSDSSSLFKLTIYGIHRSVVNPIIGKVVELPQYSGGTVASYNSRIRLAGKFLEWSAGAELAMRFNDRKNYVNNGGQEGNLIINQEEQVIGPGVFVQGLFPATTKLNIDACFRYDLIYFGVQNQLIPDASANHSGGRIMKALDPSIGMIYSLFGV